MKKLKQVNRILKLSLISFLLLQIAFSFSSNSQSVSTVSDIYNYSINEIFHTKEFAISPSIGFAEYCNIQIIDKYYSPNNDTLFYICDVKTKISSSIQPQPVYDSYVDTLFYTDLDSLINHGSLDTVYFSSSYNGRKVNSKMDTSLHITKRADYIDGCGGPYYDYKEVSGSQYTNHYLELIFFKKGPEQWGTPYYVSVDEIPLNKHSLSIYPNPSSDKIVLDINDNHFNTCSGIIYSAFGSLVRNFCFTPNEINQLDISALSKGLYFIRLTVDDDFYYSTFIKN